MKSRSDKVRRTSCDYLQCDEFRVKSLVKLPTCYFITYSPTIPPPAACNVSPVRINNIHIVVVIDLAILPICYVCNLNQSTYVEDKDGIEIKSNKSNQTNQ